MRIPPLGPRGEGWVAAQFALLALVGAAQFAGPRWSGWWALPPVAAGVALLAWSGRALGDALTAFPRPKPGVTRVRRGPYRFVSHPMYVAVVLVCLGASLRAPLALLPTFVLALVLALKATLEEQWLDERERSR